MKTVRRSVLGVVVVILAGGAWLVHRGFSRLPTTPFSQPPPSASSWDEVLARPAPITLTTLDTGFIQMDRAQNLDRSDPKIAQFDHDERFSPLANYAHWIRHDREGDYLIDTGFDRSFHDHPPYGSYSAAMTLLNRVIGVTNGQADGADLAAQLRARAIVPRGVFFTHLHPDHTAGVPALAADTPLVFGARELGFLARVGVGAHFDGKRALRTIDFSRARPMPPLGPSVDLFGDGSLWAISTPGHTADHTSFLVNARGGAVLLTGDASHFAWAFAHDVAARGIDDDGTRRAAASLAQLRAFAARYPQVKIIFGHGP